MDAVSTFRERFGAPRALIGMLHVGALPGTPAAPVPHLAYSQASGLGRILAASRDGARTHMATGLTSHLAATLMTMARDG